MFVALVHSCDTVVLLARVKIKKVVRVQPPKQKELLLEIELELLLEPTKLHFLPSSTIAVTAVLNIRRRRRRRREEVSLISD